MQRRKVNAPEILARLQNYERVQKSLRVAIELRQPTRPRHFPVIAVLAPQGQLLPRQHLLSQAEYAAISAHQQSLRCLLDSDTSGGKPRCLHGHTEIDTVALPKSFGTHSLYSRRKYCSFETSMRPYTRNACPRSFVVPTNNPLHSQHAATPYCCFGYLHCRFYICAAAFPAH